MKRLFFITITILTLLLLFFPVAAHADGISAPSGERTIVFAVSDVPLTDADPSQAAPLGIGPLATGGTSMTLSVSLEAFAQPVDIYVGILIPGPCATTVVPVVRLKIEGGFNIVNNQVSGTGSARVTYNTPCSIDSLDGGGASYSCSVTGTTPGTFAIGGYVTGTKSITGYGFQPTAMLTLTEETQVGLIATNTWVNPATGAQTVLPLTYHAGSFSALLEASGVYNTPFEVTTVVCDGWMTQTLETEISSSFEGSITVLGGTGSTRYFHGKGQLFFYESPFHIDGDVESYTTMVK